MLDRDVLWVSTRKVLAGTLHSKKTKFHERERPQDPGSKTGGVRGREGRNNNKVSGSGSTQKK